MARALSGAHERPREQPANRLLDYLGLNAACYEWADSYDSKDWERLKKCIAPTLRVSFLYY